MQLRSRRIGDEDPGGVEVNLDRSATPSVDEEASDKDFVVVKSKGAKMMERQRSIAGDEGNIAILLFLYVLQGIPLGLAAAVPLILTNRHVSYREQVRRDGRGGMARNLNGISYFCRLSSPSRTGPSPSSCCGPPWWTPASCPPSGGGRPGWSQCSTCWGRPCWPSP